MIIGLGVDIVESARFASERASEEFLARVFTRREIEACEARSQPSACLAGKFAAKEAFAKALGTGMGAEVWFTELEVGHDERGAPVLHAADKAQQQLDERGVSRVHLSLSHSAGMAVAVVVLEQDDSLPA